MTQIAVEKQIDIIHRATKEAAKTKETARQFLEDAGFLQSSAKSSLTPAPAGNSTQNYSGKSYKK